MVFADCIEVLTCPQSKAVLKRGPGVSMQQAASKHAQALSQTFEQVSVMEIRNWIRNHKVGCRFPRDIFRLEYNLLSQAIDRTCGIRDPTTQMLLILGFAIQAIPM